MLNTKAFKAILLALLLAGLASGHSIAAPVPNINAPQVLYIVDNRNWDANTLTYINYQLAQLPDDIFKVGYLFFTETSNPNNNVGGVYPRAALRFMDYNTKIAYMDFVNSLSLTNDKASNAKASLSMMEALRYFNAGTPYAGNNKVKADYAGNTYGTLQDKALHALPGNALSSLSATSYNKLQASPFAKKFIIYISSGVPSDNNSDLTQSNNELAALGGVTTEIPLSPSTMQNHTLDEWANFLYQNHGIITYTVDINPVATGQGPGWSQVLRSAANRGGGQYFIVNGIDPINTPIAVLGVIDNDNDQYNWLSDNCPNVPNDDQADADNDYIGDVCDSGDTDGDTIADMNDNCVSISNTAQKDLDLDGMGDECDPTPMGIDTDGDGFYDQNDNCPLVFTKDQNDFDSDGKGDACDDSDSDGITDDVDNCKLITNSTQTDTDGDGNGNACDSTPNGDNDYDGIDNLVDNCPLVSNPDQLNGDGDQWGNACDAAPNDYNNDGWDLVCKPDPDLDTVANGPKISKLGYSCDSGYTVISQCDNSPWSCVYAGELCLIDSLGRDTCTIYDNCPTIPNTNQANMDADQWGDVCDAAPNDYNNDGFNLTCKPDQDNDGVANGPNTYPLGYSCPSGYVLIASTDNKPYNGGGIIIDTGVGPPPPYDNCPTIPNPGQQDFDADSKGDACDDSDNDELTDAAELTLGINPNNPFDPPIPAPGANLILGIDDRNFGTPDFDPASASGVAWQGDGNYLASGTLERMRDIVMTAAYDFCGVGTTGLWCWWWVSDDDVINNDALPPVIISSTPAAVVHDETGFLRYEQSPGVWAPAITDAFKISSNHHNRSCVVSKTHGVWCWAVNSLIDPVASTIPAELKNVTTVTDVAVGGEHACAINNGAVQCWGDNTSGKTTVPGVVSTPKQLTAGSNHSCAIHTNGSVSCWGDNSLSQLGDSNADGYVDGVSNALRIAAGDNHTCAITGSYIAGGTSVVCWGDNSVSQVSAIPAALTNYSKTPVLIRAAGNTSCVSNAPNTASESALMCWPATLLP